MKRSVIVSMLVVFIAVLGGVGAAVTFPTEFAQVVSSLGAPFQDPVIGCWESQVAPHAAVQCFSEDGSYTAQLLGLPGAGHWERLSDQRVRVETTTLASTTATTFDMWIRDDALHIQAEGEREVRVFVRMAGATTLEAPQPLGQPPTSGEEGDHADDEWAGRERLAREGEMARLAAEAERAVQEARAIRAQAEAAQAAAARAAAPADQP